jgi:hypothetical protein
MTQRNAMPKIVLRKRRRQLADHKGPIGANSEAPLPAVGVTYLLWHNAGCHPQWRPSADLIDN